MEKLHKGYVARNAEFKKSTEATLNSGVESSKEVYRNDMKSAPKKVMTDEGMYSQHLKSVKIALSHFDSETEKLGAGTFRDAYIQRLTEVGRDLLVKFI
jgi:hypothetical protein